MNIVMTIIIPRDNPLFNKGINGYDVRYNDQLKTVNGKIHNKHDTIAHTFSVVQYKQPNLRYIKIFQ